MDFPCNGREIQVKEKSRQIKCDTSEIQNQKPASRNIWRHTGHSASAFLWCDVTCECDVGPRAKVSLSRFHYTHDNHTHRWQGQALWLLWGNSKVESKNIRQHVTSREVYSYIGTGYFFYEGLYHKDNFIGQSPIKVSVVYLHNSEQRSDWLIDRSVAAQKVELNSTFDAHHRADFTDGGSVQELLLIVCCMLLHLMCTLIVCCMSFFRVFP